MKIVEIPRSELGRWVAERIAAGDPEAVVLVTLFGGDRLTAAEIVLAARDRQGRILGVATVGQEVPDAPPQLIGLYVVPEARRRGIGRALLQAALERAPRLVVDVLSAPMEAFLRRLPEDLRGRLDVRMTLRAIDPFLIRRPEDRRGGR